MLKQVKHLTGLAASIGLATSLMAAPAQASIFGKDALKTFQQNAPADTIFYLDGKLDKQLLQMRQNADLTLAQMELMLSELELAGDQEPAVQFFTVLFADLMNTVAEGNKALIKEYGLAKDMASAIYLDGLAPVIQLAVTDGKPIIAKVEKASKESGLTATKETWGGNEVHVWALPKTEDMETGFSVVLSVHKKVATLAVVADAMNDTRKLQVLGLAPEPKSLADAGTLKNLKAKYGFTDFVSGYFNFVELTKTILNQGETKASGDLSLIDKDYAKEMEADVSKACRAEIVSLVEATPKLVFGNDAYSVKGDIADTSARVILELTDSDTVVELKKLNGHIPAHALNAKDKVFAVAQGLDIDNLTPVANTLWNRLVKAEFKCEELVQMQEQAKAMNPATIAMATAMAQGIKGVGLSIFDVELNDLASGDVGADALVTVSAENPEVLAGLLASVPQLAGVQVPTDGTAVELELPGVPPTVKPKLAIKGKNLTLFTGAKAEAEANKLTAEPLNSKGLLGMAVNYKALGALVDSGLADVGSMAFMPAAQCAEIQSNFLGMNLIDMEASVLTKISDAGLDTHVDASMNLAGVDKPSQLQAGSYQLEKLADGCFWTVVGKETLNANGTGSYELNHDTEACVTYDVDYKWQKTGARLTITEEKVMSRETCDGEMQAAEPDGYSCVVMTIDDKGFTCMYNYGGGDKEMYRYTKQ